MQWTHSAQAALDEYLTQARRNAEAAGGDPAEVADDLRRHIEAELAALGLPVVNEADVRRIVARLGAPEADAPPAAHQPSANPPAEPRQGCWHTISTGTLLFFGVILPLLTLGIEYFTGACAGILFDPLPTVGHILVSLFVPVANLLVWLAVRNDHLRHRAKLGLASGAVLGVTLVYTLLFAPITPFAIIAIIYGIGFLPLTPLLALVATGLLRLRLRQAGGGAARFPGLWSGLALGIGVLALCWLPMFITATGLQMAASDVPSESDRGVRMLRSFGQDEWLLRACYGWAGRGEQLYSFGKRIQPEAARTIYYRVTGQAFNAVPPPKLYAGRGRWTLLEDEFTWDTDQGGDAVAGRVKGLSLLSSRQDGFVDSEAALAYSEWTLEFKNDSLVQREARAQIALPPGAVVTRLTLWIDGEEREAAFSGRAQVKAAYKEVVQQRRDPVLVTTCGPDRVLLQCFPVPPNGGRMKVRAGITAPLVLTSQTNGVFCWPHFLERNFSLREELKHSLWLESGQPLASALRSLPAEPAQDGLHALRGQVNDRELASPPARVRVRRAGQAPQVWTADTRGGAGFVVRQTLVEVSAARPDRVVLVVDGSRGMDEFHPAIAAALAKVPEGMELAVLRAADGVDEICQPPRPADAATRERVAKNLRQARNTGGHDNVPALARAWDLAAQSTNGIVVWIHGPQPVLLDSAEGLKQRLERRPQSPRLLEVQTEAGPNRVAENLDGLAAVQSLPRVGSLREDLERLFTGWQNGAKSLQAVRERGPDASPEAGKPTSLHLARLWAASEVTRLRLARQTAEAAQLAALYQLVTPVSGAVVLETKEQFHRVGLEPVDVATVPTVPEPATWLVLAAGLLLLGLLRRRARA